MNSATSTSLYAGILTLGLSCAPQAVLAATCPTGSSGSTAAFELNTIAPDVCFASGSGSINGSNNDEFLASHPDYVLLSKTDDPTKGAAPGALLDIVTDTTEGVWSIDSSLVSGYSNLVIAFKSGIVFEFSLALSAVSSANNASIAWGAFKVGDVLTGTWASSKDLSHANLYGTPVPLPPALWLFGSAMAGLAGIGLRRRDNVSGS